MSRIIRRATARQELDEIADYLGRSSLTTALRFVDAAERAFESLAAMPGTGGHWESDRPGLADVRVWPVPGFPNHLIFYRPLDDGVEILRVLHAARDLESLLGDEP